MADLGQRRIAELRRAFSPDVKRANIAEIDTVLTNEVERHLTGYQAFANGP